VTSSPCIRRLISCHQNKSLECGRPLLEVSSAQLNLRERRMAKRNSDGRKVKRVVRREWSAQDEKELRKHSKRRLPSKIFRKPLSGRRGPCGRKRAIWDFPLVIEVVKREGISRPKAWNLGCGGIEARRDVCCCRPRCLQAGRASSSRRRHRGCLDRNLGGFAALPSSWGLDLQQPSLESFHQW